MANSFFRTVLNRVIEARQRQAEPYITNAAMNFDDQQLAALGMNRAELAKKPRARSIF